MFVLLFCILFSRSFGNVGVVLEMRSKNALIQMGHSCLVMFFEACVSDVSTVLLSESCLADSCHDNVTLQICVNTFSCCTFESLGRRVIDVSFYPCFECFFNIVWQC